MPPGCYRTWACGYSPVGRAVARAQAPGQPLALSNHRFREPVLLKQQAMGVFRFAEVLVIENKVRDTIVLL